MSDEKKFDFTLGDGFITSGKDMLAELMERRHGYKEEEKTPPATVQQETTPPPQMDAGELAALRQQIAEQARLNGELQGRLSSQEREAANLRNWLATQTQGTQRAEQPKIPHVAEGVDDPILAAALNTLQARVDTTLQAVTSQIQQTNYTQSANQEMQRIRMALGQVAQEFPEWRQFATDEKINEFISPYVRDPNRHGQIDWQNEFRNAARTFDYPSVVAKLQAAEKRLEQFESKTNHEREKQKRDLNQVPRASGGARSGGSNDSHLMPAERILNGYRKQHGRRAVMPWDQFSTSLVGEIRQKYGQ